MYIIADFKSFKKTIQSIQVVLQKENNIFIYANKETQCVTLEASYNGIYIKRIIKTEVIESGSLSIDSTFLTGLRIVGNIELQKVDEGSLEFKCDKIKGNLKLNQESAESKIDNNIETNITINKKELLDYIKKVNFLDISTQEGVHIKIGSNITLAAFDRIKMALYKDKSPKESADFDVLVNPIVITKVISYINENKINIGTQNAIIKIETPSFLCYFPTIQMEPEDIDGWLQEIPVDECKGTISTITEYILDTIKSTHSIAGTAKNYDMKLLFKITDKIVTIITESNYGKAEALINLLDSDIKNLTLLINSQHLKEMLELVKVGPLTIKIWEDYIILYCLSNKYTIVIPTIQDNIGDQY